MTLAKYLYLLKKHQKACSLIKFPPFCKNELKKKILKQQKQNKTKTYGTHLFLSVGNNNRYLGSRTNKTLKY